MVGSSRRRQRRATAGALGALFSMSMLLAMLVTGAHPALAQVVPPLEAQAADDNAPLDAEGAEYHLAFMINELRAVYGVPPLEVDGVLVELARERDWDMIQRGYFGHWIPGLGFGPTWLQTQVPRAAGTGENLGLSVHPNSVVLGTLFRSWLDSPTHLENMIRPEFNRVGIGVVEVPTTAPGITMKVVTQYFAIASGPLRRA